MPPRLNEDNVSIETGSVDSFSSTITVTTTPGIGGSVAASKGVSTASCSTPPTASIIPSDSSSSSSNKTVRFNEVIRGKPVLHHLDYTDEEKKLAWYSRSEIAVIRLHAKHFVTTIETAAREPRDYCNKTGIIIPEFRGLEHLTKWGMKQRKRARDVSRNGVLTEQTRQQTMDDFDPEYIAFIYRSNEDTKSSRECAYQLGLFDQQQPAQEQEQQQQEALYANEQN